jgi:oxygen-independent coproporphyrinogen-3 oxidase
MQAGEFDADEDLACAMYEELQSRATEAGFRQYEVANFARELHRKKEAVDNWRNGTSIGRSTDSSSFHHSIPAFACRHNINYWRGRPFYGLGPSATSYVRGIRTRNWSNTQLYCEQLERGKRAIESSEELSPLRRAGETAAFGLRMVAGWPFADFQIVTGHDLRREWAGELKELVDRGWGQIAPDCFRLTRRGLRFADAAGEMFLK